MAEPKLSSVRAPIALTMGDPAGIGPEIAAKAWSARRHAGLSAFVLIAEPALIAQRARQANIELPIKEIGSAGEAATVFDTALPVLPVTDALPPIEPGQPDMEYAASVIAAIDTGVGLVLAGDAKALVTNPIAKSVVSAAGFGFPGHTDYLGSLVHKRGLPATPVMMLVGGGLRTVPVTVHIPLREAAETLTAEKIIEAATVTHRALMADFAIATPRLAVTGLNPHAGEDGVLGTEERDIIEPAMGALTRQGVNVIGPLPADTAFHAGARTRYDAILGMYHDQALIPVKTLAFDEGVNVTLGLPFVRTSPDHGTAFDIAGTGKARPDSLIAALKLADDMALARAMRREAEV